MNIILEKILESKNNFYVHALEVESVEDIDNCIAEIVNHFYDDGLKAIQEFFNTMQIIYIGDNKEIENQVYEYITDELIESYYE